LATELKVLAIQGSRAATSPTLGAPPAVGCAPLTVRRVAGGWRCVLKDDGHEGLADGALPRLGHLAPDAAVGRHLAGGGRVLQEGLGLAGGQRVGVLPDEVAHGARDQLEAVRVRSRRDQREVAGGTHFQDLGQRDLLQGEGPSEVAHVE